MDRLLHRLERGAISDRVILKTLFFAGLAVTLLLLITLSRQYAAVVPVAGGDVREGIVGIPRFINPALAVTRADQDVVALVYSGLLRLDDDGTLIPDVAESIQVSDDGRTYSVTLRKNVTFHDNTPLTAEDVTFTIGLIQDAELKSPLRGVWNDVSVNVLSEYDLEITLEEAYAPFNENFTLGIMPKHLWKDVPVEQLPFSQYNTEPIGSGPFMVSDVGRDTAGLINRYTLARFPGAQKIPNLSSIELVFYQNEDDLTRALKDGDIHSTAYLPTHIVSTINPEQYEIIEAPLPRLFGVFFNQNRSVIARDRAVREALAAAIDREALVTEILHGYGIPTATPIAPTTTMLDWEQVSQDPTSTPSPDAGTPSLPATILENGGWVKTSLGTWEKRLGGSTETLRVTLRTSNSPLFSALSEHIARRWRALGVEVEVTQFEQADLVQSVIRPRDFEALLFGMDLNRTEDLYPFWHSSQKDDPGLNVAQYTNITVDRLLEEARRTHETNARTNLLAEAGTRIAAETPAIFLFTPTLTYVVHRSITITPLPTIHRPADRFVTVASWYAATDYLWPWFRNQEPQ
jgi:peptide/nickel transport system substrate-binding protein